MIFIWLNFGVLPFWFMLLFFPQAKICKIFVTSVFPILILAIIDLYLIIEISKNGFNFIDIFNLYIGIDHLLNENMHSLELSNWLNSLRNKD